MALQSDGLQRHWQGLCAEAALILTHVTLVTCTLPRASQIVFQFGLQGHTAGQYQTGGEEGRNNAAAIAFRIVVPGVLFLSAALFTRFW